MSTTYGYTDQVPCRSCGREGGKCWVEVSDGQGRGLCFECRHSIPRLHRITLEEWNRIYDALPVRVGEKPRLRTRSEAFVARRGKS